MTFKTTDDELRRIEMLLEATIVDAIYSHRSVRQAIANLIGPLPIDVEWEIRESSNLPPTIAVKCWRIVTAS